MDTQVSAGVPFTQSRTWSHALLAADSALLMPRACKHWPCQVRDTLKSQLPCDLCKASTAWKCLERSDRDGLEPELELKVSSA